MHKIFRIYQICLEANRDISFRDSEIVFTLKNLLKNRVVVQWAVQCFWNQLNCNCLGRSRETPHCIWSWNNLAHFQIITTLGDSNASTKKVRLTDAPKWNWHRLQTRHQPYAGSKTKPLSGVCTSKDDVKHFGRKRSQCERRIFSLAVFDVICSDRMRRVSKNCCFNVCILVCCSHTNMVHLLENAPPCKLLWKGSLSALLFTNFIQKRAFLISVMMF